MESICRNAYDAAYGQMNKASVTFLFHQLFYCRVEGIVWKEVQVKVYK